MLLTSVESFDKAKKLHEDKLRKSGYNKVIRPVKNVTDRIVVNIGLKLSQLIDVDEKNQYMTTNVWLIIEWTDPTLSWDPDDYEGVKVIYVPAAEIWHPDIVLYNTADGTYETTVGTKAKVDPTGKVYWRPPASFKVACTIDVTYFPLDQQNCYFDFGSWTYNQYEVDIRHIDQTYSDDISQNCALNKPYVPITTVEQGIDLSDFYKSVEFDIMAAPASKLCVYYAGSEEPFPMWRFTIIIRRKFLFYTVNLIIPLISHAFLTILVFYIPANSHQKMNLSINILLSLTVSFLMLAEIIPQNSLVVPLLTQYLLFTLTLVATSVMVTAIAYNVHFRSSSTHVMPDWTRKVFLYWLPKILMMKRPKIENSQDVNLRYIKLRMCSCVDGDDSTDQRLVDSQSGSCAGSTYQYGSTRRTRTHTELMNLTRELDEDTKAIRRLDLSYEVQKAIEGALYIANHLKKEDQFQRTQEDWKYVALVVDRVFLWIYGVVCLFGTIAIICQAPMLYDNRKPIVH
jgi:nicotinic acetylcholine receptor